MRRGLIALLPFAAMLAGCWQSYGERISYVDADMPAIEGTYQLTAPDAVPKTVRVLEADNRYYSMTGIDSEGLPYTDELRFDRLEGSWYLVQALGDEGTYYYRIVRIAGRTVEEFDPACDESELAFPGVIDDLGDCEFGRYEGLRDAALARIGRHEGGETGSLNLIGTYTR